MNWKLLAAIAYLGLRGGPATLHEHVDWAAVLAAPSPAAGRPPVEPRGATGWRRALPLKTANAADHPVERAAGGAAEE